MFMIDQVLLLLLSFLAHLHFKNSATIMTVSVSDIPLIFPNLRVADWCSERHQNQKGFKESVLYIAQGMWISSDFNYLDFGNCKLVLWIVIIALIHYLLDGDGTFSFTFPECSWMFCTTCTRVNNGNIATIAMPQSQTSWGRLQYGNTHKSWEKVARISFKKSTISRKYVNY